MGKLFIEYRVLFTLTRRLLWNAHAPTHLSHSQLCVELCRQWRKCPAWCGRVGNPGLFSDIAFELSGDYTGWFLWWLKVKLLSVSLITPPTQKVDRFVYIHMVICFVTWLFLLVYPLARINLFFLFCFVFLPLDYLLSNNYVNSIIVHKFDFSDEEIMAYYISFLKTLSLKLNNHTVHFFYNEVSDCGGGAFGCRACWSEQHLCPGSCYPVGKTGSPFRPSFATSLLCDLREVSVL